MPFEYVASTEDGKLVKGMSELASFHMDHGCAKVRISLADGMTQLTSQGQSFCASIAGLIGITKRKKGQSACGQGPDTDIGATPAEG